MPINYSKYPDNWLTEIRPSVLLRAKNCCEKCLVANYKLILRGTWNGVNCYQDDDGRIFNADNGEYMDSTYLGEVHSTNKLIKVILTVAHLDHNIDNNDLENLRAWCQRCHLRHDADFHKANRAVSRKNKKGLIEIDFNI